MKQGNWLIKILHLKVMVDVLRHAPIIFFDKARKPCPAAFWFNLGPSQNLSVESILQAVPCVPSVVAGC